MPFCTFNPFHPSWGYASFTTTPQSPCSVARVKTVPTGMRGFVRAVFNKLSRHLHRFLWKQHIRRLKLEFQKASILSVVGRAVMLPNLPACGVMTSLLPGILQKRVKKEGGNSLIFLKIIRLCWQMTIPQTKTESPESLTPKWYGGPSVFRRERQSSVV